MPSYCSRNLTRFFPCPQVVILAFSAGRVPATVPKRMAAAAETAVRRTLRTLGPAGRGVPVEVEAVVEPPERAFGASGISLHVVV